MTSNSYDHSMALYFVLLISQYANFLDFKLTQEGLCLYVVLNLLTYLKSCCLNLYWDKLGWLVGN